MFKRFTKTRTPAPCTPGYKVVCRYTGNTLLVANRATCRAYVQAFGLCYVAAC